MIEKRCNRCFEDKDLMKDFYMCSGQYRPECKKCTCRRNNRYQKKAQSYRSRDVDPEIRRVYMRAYYANNKERFATYRAEARLRDPEYYKNYFRKRKQKL